MAELRRETSFLVLAGFGSILIFAHCLRNLPEHFERPLVSLQDRTGQDRTRHRRQTNRQTNKQTNQTKQNKKKQK